MMWRKREGDEGGGTEQNPFRLRGQVVRAVESCWRWRVVCSASASLKWASPSPLAMPRLWLEIINAILA